MRAQLSWTERLATNQKVGSSNLSARTTCKHPRTAPPSSSQIRHPERSAERIYRIADGSWRAVEGPRRRLLADVLRGFPATDSWAKPRDSIDIVYAMLKQKAPTIPTWKCFSRRRSLLPTVKISIRGLAWAQRIAALAIIAFWIAFCLNHNDLPARVV